MTNEEMLQLAGYYYQMKQQMEAEKWRRAIIKKEVLDRMVGK